MVHRTLKDWTQIMPFPEATDLQHRIASSLAMMTAWNAALSGQFMLSEVISVLARQAGAANIAVYRADARKAWPIASAVSPHATRTPETSSGFLFQFIKETRPDDMFPGAIFRLSELRDDPRFQTSAAHREWSQRNSVYEVSMIILEVTDKKTDVIEVLFEGEYIGHPDLPSQIVTQALANAWELRAPGLMTSLIQNYGRDRSADISSDDEAILGANNPCGLSRAEQRVCTLLFDGMKARDIADALGLSVPTVRSHLRNIYGKTETSGQVELIAVINARSKETT